MQSDVPKPAERRAPEDYYSRSWDAFFDSDSEDTSIGGKHPPASFPRRKKKLSSFRRRKFCEDFDSSDAKVDLPNPIEMKPMRTVTSAADSGMTRESLEPRVSPICSDSKISDDESISPRIVGLSSVPHRVPDDAEELPPEYAAPNVQPPIVPDAASRLMEFFISKEKAHCESIRKIHELSGLYKMQQHNCVCEQTSIMFPPVIETFLQKMCEFSSALHQISEEECEDPISAILECCVVNLSDLADEYILYANTYYSSRDMVFEILREDIEFLKLCEHKSKDWEKYDDAKCTTLLELLHAPVIHSTQQVAFFETLSRKLNLDSDDLRKHELIMNVMEILQRTQEGICAALEVPSLQEVDSRTKEANNRIYKRARLSSLTQFARMNSYDSSLILPDGVPEPRLRKNTNWDMLGGSYSVKKGHFYKLSRKGKPKLYCFWLFNDTLLYGYDKNSVWKTRKGLVIDKNFVVNQVQHREYANAFEIRSSRKSFIAFSATAEQKVSWMEAFNSVQWKALYDPPDVQQSSPLRARMSSRCDVCEMQSCSNSVTGMLGFFQKLYCGFCGKCICSDCGRYTLPYPGERKDQRACVRCYFKVMKYPQLKKQYQMFPPGHYLAFKDRIPVRRLDSVASEKLPDLQQGDIVHVTECRFASARIDSPENGYIPLFYEGHKVLCDWDIKSWTTDSVCEFVENIDCPQYVDKFRELKIQGEDLYSMCEGDLDRSLIEDFGMTEHILRHRFLRKLQLLKECYDSDHECNYDNISEGGESRSSIVEDVSEVVKAVAANPARDQEGIPNQQTAIADMILGNVPDV